MRSVYVASAGRKRHKVGLSGNPRRRLAGLSSVLGKRLVLSHVSETPNAEAVERLAHWILRGAHLYGEWFNVDAETAKGAVCEAVARVSAGEVAPSRIAGPGRPQQFPIRITLPITARMAARIDAALRNGETRVDWIRDAIDRELKRRERETKG